MKNFRGMLVVMVMALVAIAGCGSDDPVLPDKPQISPDRIALNFGGDFANAVYVGTFPLETLELKNGGKQTLVISSITISPSETPFTIRSDKTSVESKQKALVEVTYSPKVPGKSTATLTILSNAENTPKLDIALSATAVAP